MSQCSPVSKSLPESTCIGSQVHSRPPPTSASHKARGIWLPVPSSGHAARGRAQSYRALPHRQRSDRDAAAVTAVAATQRDQRHQCRRPRPQQRSWQRPRLRPRPRPRQVARQVVFLGPRPSRCRSLRRSRSRSRRMCSCRCYQQFHEPQSAQPVRAARAYARISHDHAHGQGGSAHALYQECVIIIYAQYCSYDIVVGSPR